jgi:type II secretory pathway component PulM
MTTWGVPLTREEGQSQRLAAAFWSDLVKGEEDKKWFPARQKQRLPAALRTTNSRIDGAVHKLEKLPSSNEEQTTCEDAVEEVCTPSAESTSLQLNGLLSFYQTQLQTQLHPGKAKFYHTLGLVFLIYHVVILLT